MYLAHSKKKGLNGPAKANPLFVIANDMVMRPGMQNAGENLWWSLIWAPIRDAETCVWEDPLIVCANVPRFVFFLFSIFLFFFGRYVGRYGIEIGIRLDWIGEGY